MQLKFTDGAMNPNSATTLNSMGKVYLRKASSSSTKEALKDAKRAEGCFLRALQLFRLSMVKSGNEKVVDTLYNLNEARERQTKKKGILRNVRFQSTNVQTSRRSGGEASETDDSLSISVSEEEVVDEVITKYSSFSETSEGTTWYFDMGFVNLFNCGATDARDDYEIENDLLHGAKN